jgi:hypothetical protein
MAAHADRDEPLGLDGVGVEAERAGERTREGAVGEDDGSHKAWWRQASTTARGQLLAGSPNTTAGVVTVVAAG